VRPIGHLPAFGEPGEPLGVDVGEQFSDRATYRRKGRGVRPAVSERRK
jgi:hypothetical protein